MRKNFIESCTNNGHFYMFMASFIHLVFINLVKLSYDTYNVFVHKILVSMWDIKLLLPLHKEIRSVTYEGFCLLGILQHPWEGGDAS